MTDYKAIAAWLGEPYLFAGDAIWLDGDSPLSDWDLVGAVLEKLTIEDRMPSLHLSHMGHYVSLRYHYMESERRPTPIEAISALVVAMKETP